MQEKPSALDAIARYLGIRDYADLELRRRLYDKEYSEEEIEAALEEARNRKWLLPPEDLSEKVAKKLHEKFKSYQYIVMYLKSKGLPTTQKDEDLEFEKAKGLVDRKFSVDGAISFEQKKKILQYLRNRSYDEAIIRTVIDAFESN